jgi:alpha-ketoglutaric semialdehyde dehydrogenase
VHGASGLNSEQVHAGSFVAGRWHTEGDEVARINPAHPAEIVGTYVPASAELAADAVEAARDAAPAWRAATPIDRARVVRRAAQLIEERGEHIARLMTREEGKTLTESRGEVHRTVDTLHFHATSAWGPAGTRYDSSSADEHAWTQRVPVGVVAAITPWNFPLLIPAWKLAPALVHGNTVVWKPASDTPLVAAELARALIDAGLPDGVLNLVLGSGTVGAQLVADEGVDAITFTGSEPVGREIQGTAVARGAKVQLELGGHNPAIVLPDADLEQAVAALVAGATSGSGQKCTATRRILVHDEIHDELLERLVKSITALRVGDGLVEGVDVGPLVSSRARDEVAGEIDRAVREGAEALAGGGRLEDDELDGGYYIAPTVLATADHDLRICREEVFGPVTTVLPVGDVDEAFARANDTRFGLAAAVFTADERVVRRAAMELHAGMVNINCSTTGSELHVPFGGMKASSSPGPKEQGETARDFYTELKAIYVVPAG